MKWKRVKSRDVVDVRGASPSKSGGGPGGEIGERDGRFLVLLRWRGQGKGSGAPVDAEGAHLWEFRQGLAVRFDVYRDRGHAIRDFEAR